MNSDLHVEVSVGTRRPPPPGRQVVMDAAVSFLDGQRRLLRSGLDDPTDDAVVADVARRHEAAHEAWVSTVAALRDHVDDEVIQHVIDLYGFHGRVAGGLAGERSIRLEGPIEAGVRRILADQLDQMTERVIVELRGAHLERHGSEHELGGSGEDG